MSVPIPKKGVSMMAEESSSTGLPGGAESNENTLLPAARWRHPESGQEAILTSDPLYGDSQARAFERAGFKFVEEVDPATIKPQLLASESHADSTGAKSEARLAYDKGVEARLNALEAENARLREAALPTPGVSAEATQAGDLAKEAGTVKNEVQTGVKVDPATGSEAGAESTEAAEVSKTDSRTKLEEVATAEGLTDLEQYDTKAKLVEAIENHRKAGVDADTDGGNE